MGTVENPSLRALLEGTLSDSRWDMPYLGMQVLIEGLALAAFGMLRDATTRALPRQILAYVMADEARHVAFGRIALREQHAQLTSAELREREEFVIEGCFLMRDRFRAQEVWEQLELDVEDCLDHVDHSEVMGVFRSLLFSRIVPCVRDIGLWSPRVQAAYREIGVEGYATADLDALMAADEQLAAGLDRHRRSASGRARRARELHRLEQAELAVRRAEVEEIASLGGEHSGG